MKLSVKFLYLPGIRIVYHANYGDLTCQNGYISGVSIRVKWQTTVTLETKIDSQRWPWIDSQRAMLNLDKSGKLLLLYCTSFTVWHEGRVTLYGSTLLYSISKVLFLTGYTFCGSSKSINCESNSVHQQSAVYYCTVTPIHYVKLTCGSVLGVLQYVCNKHFVVKEGLTVLYLSPPSPPTLFKIQFII